MCIISDVRCDLWLFYSLWICVAYTQHMNELSMKIVCVLEPRSAGVSLCNIWRCHCVNYLQSSAAQKHAVPTCSDRKTHPGLVCWQERSFTLQDCCAFLRTDYSNESWQHFWSRPGHTEERENVNRGNPEPSWPWDINQTRQTAGR